MVTPPLAGLNATFVAAEIEVVEKGLTAAGQRSILFVMQINVRYSNLFESTRQEDDHGRVPEPA
jgi:hypothetical protein